MITRRWVLFLLLLSATAPLKPGKAAEELKEAARSVVQGLIDDTVALVKDRSLSDHERRIRLRAIFTARFDLPGIARATLGRYWPMADQRQRDEFSLLFANMVVENYGGRVLRSPRNDGPSSPDQRPFEITAVRQETSDGALVMSQAWQPGSNKPTRVDWRVTRGPDGGTRIIDVIIEGISLRLSHQEDFAATIQRSGRGVDGLLEQLRTKFGE